MQIYLAYFLLTVFTWVIIPTHTIHNLFADHQDTPDDFCLVHHAHLGTHVEEQHTHCDILKLNTPVYSLPELEIVQVAVSEINTSPAGYSIGDFKPNLLYSLPSRAPPLI